MKKFSEKVQINLKKFILEGNLIVLRVTEYSFGRTSMKRYANVKKSLQSAISDYSNLDATVHYYGSRIVGTSLFVSDLDFFIEVGKYLF